MDSEPIISDEAVVNSKSKKRKTRKKSVSAARRRPSSRPPFLPFKSVNSLSNPAPNNVPLSEVRSQLMQMGQKGKRKRKSIAHKDRLSRLAQPVKHDYQLNDQCTFAPQTNLHNPRRKGTASSYKHVTPKYMQPRVYLTRDDLKPPPPKRGPKATMRRLRRLSKVPERYLGDYQQNHEDLSECTFTPRINSHPNDVEDVYDAHQMATTHKYHQKRGISQSVSKTKRKKRTVSRAKSVPIRTTRRSYINNTPTKTSVIPDESLPYYDFHE